ncbi:MAG: aspartyl-tRNA amidotransferase subunit B [Patescibacteria group bacterium]|nr:MAG: aspartyl-tRNA amidotransferase subunit B [Patescibacteria group bacterium]
MIRQTITQKIGEAMKAKDSLRLSTLKLLASALNYEFINKQHELTDDEEIAVVRREIKKRKDAIEAYLKVGQEERARTEEMEMAILKEFLPEEASEEEISKAVDEVISEFGKSPANFGRIMGSVMQKLAGKADGSLVSQLVKQKLS